jgi:hypothetical protein
MSRRGRAIAPGHDTFHKPATESRRSVPQTGDILASERSARADVYTVSIVPGAGAFTVGRYSAAIARVQELARTLRVDGWFTSDHTHYLRVASHRA